MEFVASTPGSAGLGVGSVTIAGGATPVGRTVLMVVNNDAAISAVIKELGVFFDGVTAGNSPVLVELMKCSCATNASLGATATVTQWRGPSNTSGAGLAAKFQAFAGYVSEPTVLTRLEQWLVPPTSGLVLPLPLGDEAELIPGVSTMGLALRITPSQAINVQAYMRVAQGVT